MREFGTGATRDENANKPDYRGFLSGKAIKRFGEYMHKHRLQADGSMRRSDNWKLGIPIPAYTESLIRHTIDFLREIENLPLGSPEADELACAIWFNVQGYLHERAKLQEKMQEAHDHAQIHKSLVDSRPPAIPVDPFGPGRMEPSKYPAKFDDLYISDSTGRVGDDRTQGELRHSPDSAGAGSGDDGVLFGSRHVLGEEWDPEALLELATRIFGSQGGDGRGHDGHPLFGRKTRAPQVGARDQHRDHRDVYGDSDSQRKDLGESA